MSAATMDDTTATIFAETEDTAAMSGMDADICSQQ